MKNIKKIIEEVRSQNPYKEPGSRDSYSPYNEGWQDACDAIYGAMESVVNPRDLLISYIMEKQRQYCGMPDQDICEDLADEFISEFKNKHL